MKSIYSFCTLVLIGISSIANAQSFDKIRVAGTGKVTIVQGTPASVKTEENSDAAGLYSINNDGWLTVNSGSNNEITVVMPTLTRVDITGTGKLETASEFKVDDVELKVSGVGKLEVNMVASKVRIVISGAGKVELEGSADDLRIDISGSGKVEGEHFKVKNCVANISGSGKCLVDVTDELTSNISGTGSVYYVTPPAKINNNISGMGKVADVSVPQIDTTRITIGKRRILIIGEEGVDNRISFSDTLKLTSAEKVKSHWAGFELGINMLTDKDFVPSPPKGYGYLDQKTEKSIAVNINLLNYDIKLYRRNIMLVTGLGFTFNNYRFTSDQYLAADAPFVSAIYDSIDYKKNKLAIHYLTVPLLLEFNTSQNPHKTFHVAAGVIGGLRIGSHLKLVDDVNGDKHKNKVYDSFNINPFRYDATLRMGYGNFTVFADYSLSTLFRDNKGPEVYPLTLGVKLVGW